MTTTAPPLGPGEIDLGEIARLVRAADVPAFVQNTGGGAAVVYAGHPYTHADGDRRYPAAAGPGRFIADPVLGWTRMHARGRLEDFTFGPDDGGQGDTEGLTAAELGVRTPAQAAAVLLAQVLTPGRVLTLAQGRLAAALAGGR